MEVKVDRIYSAAAGGGANGEEINGSPADIIVHLTNGDQYIASFFTYAKIEELRRLHRQNGAYLRGCYFWSKNMVLVEDCLPKTIEKIVEHLLEEGEFREAFEKI
ncbi:MAG: hypothetical protein KDD14_25015 [Saprospiraceae bacterium]|nr:hypothetical protein [Saprospiraceae bacterium]